MEIVVDWMNQGTDSNSNSNSNSGSSSSSDEFQVADECAIDARDSEHTTLMVKIG